MALSFAPAQQVTSTATVPVDQHIAGRPQHILLSLVDAVRNLRDESDLQCLAFLAGELGLLHSTPFCFSRVLPSDAAIPESLVLRDTFHAMIEQRLLGWENGQLRALVAPGGLSSERTLVHDRVSWLGALMPSERQVLTRVTVQLHAAGQSLLQSSAEVLFRRFMSRLTGTGEAAEVAERRLSLVRHQLTLA